MKSKKQSGLTLVELLISIIIFSIIVIAIYNIFQVHNLMAAKQEEKTLMQQELMSALTLIADDMRMCGYSPEGGPFGFEGNSTFGRATSNTSIYCTMDMLNQNGLIDDDDNATEHAGYRLNVDEQTGNPLATPNNNLYKFTPFTNGTKWTVLATNIGDLRFEYFNQYGDLILNATSSASAIRTIQITATAVPSQRRENLGIGNRTMTTIVKSRNLGI